LLGTEGSKPVLGLSAKVARKAVRGWTNRKHLEFLVSIHGSKQVKGFLKRSSAKSVWELFKYSRNQLRTMTGQQTGHCHLKGYSYNWSHMGNFCARSSCIFYSTPSLTSVFSLLFSWFYSVAWPRFFGAQSEYSQRLLLTGIMNLKCHNFFMFFYLAKCFIFGSRGGAVG